MFRICNLHQKHFRILYSQSEKEFIDRMPELTGKEWNKKGRKLDYSQWLWGDGTLIDNLIGSIKKALIEGQGLFCAYCGMELRLTSEEQIEHIAPKGRGRYPQFMFNVSNLTLACGLCNGFEKKEKKEHFKTIAKLSDNYEECLFNIVHPYLDDPSEHYDLGRNGNGITISSKSLKGQKSITVFKLNEEPHTNARGQYLREYQYRFDPKYKQAFEDSCARNGIR